MKWLKIVHNCEAKIFYHDADKTRCELKELEIGYDAGRDSLWNKSLLICSKDLSNLYHNLPVKSSI